MNKKIIISCLAICLLVILFGCTSSPNKDKTIRIGVSVYRFDDNFMTLYREEIKNYIETLNGETVKYEITILDADNDQHIQNEQIDTFIKEKYDVLIVNMVQSSSALEIIEKVKTKNIPVVFINREPMPEDMQQYDKATYVGSDAKQAGTYQGEIILETATQGDINMDGKISYISITGEVCCVDVGRRTEYSIKALTDAGKEVELLLTQRGDWLEDMGYDITYTALEQFGKKIEVVFAENDSMALGAMTAIEELGRKVGKDIYVVGVDAIDEVVPLVEAGRITGTVLNNYVNHAHAAIDAAIDLANGKTIDKYIWIDYVKITAPK